MTKMKKLTSVLLAVVMAMGLMVPAWATEPLEEANQEPKYTYEFISLMDIDKYPEIETLLTQSNAELIDYDAALENEKEQYVQTVNQYLSEAGIAEVSAEEIESVQQAYGLAESAQQYLENAVAEDYQLLIQYDSKTKDISNAWKIQPTTTKAGFSFKLTNIGVDSIDSISGKVTLYRLSGNSWLTGAGNTSSFTKTNVKSGIFYTWSTPVYYVAEKFEYAYTVKEDTAVRSYSNAGKDNEIRYNFAAGAYQPMAALGGERHHFISQITLSAYDYDVNKAYAIRMTHADHVLTGNWGSSAAAKNFRARESQYLANKQYKDLIMLEVEDFTSKQDSYGRENLGTKYSPEIAACAIYYQNLFGITL